MEGIVRQTPALSQRVQTEGENGATGQEVGLTASVAIRIQHHASRAGLPRRLLRHLGAFEDVQVVTDNRVDLKSPNAWAAHRACLEALPDSAAHLLVLQDDALPVNGFAARYLRALEQHPDSVICLFTPGFNYFQKAFREAKAAGHDHTIFRVGSFVPCVAISYPRDFVTGLLKWADSRGERQRRPLKGADDGILALYCRMERVQPLLLVPSIVEHDHTVASIGKTQRRVGPHRRAVMLG